MTEPVAYRVDGTIYNNINDAEFAVREIEHLRSSLGIDNGLIKKPVYIQPLYTDEQLHPRVKMTQAEFDEFKLLYNLLRVSTVIRIINTVQNNESKRFANLKLRLNKTGKDLELIILWADYDPDNPEETIEIVPDMKWFVRSKEPEDDLLDFIFLSGSNLDDLDYLAFDYARAFDTKEEAELWTNPLTEAVQLPVE
ncbi:hypothetical protein [Leuconostoc mesenteroides]|uniref:hypothetical protein n=1 Tax=Leuconostoc mesenteroides TaxID=1245 RepID=UPI00235EE897|nr:hypothetical protein [Leuconostoc mesenteroides]